MLRALIWLLLVGLAWSQPVLQELKPATARAGSTIDLLGSGFGANPDSVKVFFGTAPATVKEVADGKVTASVPLDAPKNAPVHLEVNGQPSSNLPFVYLPSIRLTVGKNPIDAGETTTGRFQVYHEDKPVTLHYKNASPEIVRFTSGDEQTVQTSGGADNHFEFPIQGLVGNRLYNVEYNWGAKAVEIIEWKLPWTQVDYTEKEPPINPVGENIDDPPKENCHCQGGRLVLVFGANSDTKGVMLNAARAAAQLKAESHAAEAPARGGPKELKTKSHLHVLSYPMDSKNQVDWTKPTGVAASLNRLGGVVVNTEKVGQGAAAIPNDCCYFDEILLLFHDTQPAVVDGLIAQLPTILNGRPVRRVAIWSCLSVDTLIPGSDRYEKLLGVFAPKDCPCACDPALCRALDADLHPAHCPTRNQNVEVLTGAWFDKGSKGKPSLRAVNLGLNENRDFLSPDGKLRRIQIKPDMSAVVDTVGPDVPVFKDMQVKKSPATESGSKPHELTDLTRTVNVIPPTQPAYSGPHACPKKEGCQGPKI